MRLKIRTLAASWAKTGKRDLSCCVNHLQHDFIILLELDLLAIVLL